jgi:ATP-dependent Clp protease ATP-binding subunit ClpB
LSTEGFDVNVRHHVGSTALDVATANGSVEAVKALLKAGADPNLGDKFLNVARTRIEIGLHATDGNK